MAKWCVSHLAEVRAPEMAAALAFRTLFGLIPVLFVATLVTRSLLGDSFPKFVSSLVELTGLDRVGVPLVDAAAAPDAPTSAPDPTAVAPLSRWIEDVVAFTGTLNLSAIGVIGVLVVLFSAIWLMVAIEESFNVVCRVPNSRSWPRRILVYWSVLTLGPIVLAALPLLTNELRDFVGRESAVYGLYRVSEPVLAFALLWGLLTFSYAVVPASRLSWSAILIGALVAAAGLELGRNFLGFYMERAFTVNRLYGSLGLVPLFMFWVYAMWLMVLFGLQVASLLHILLRYESRRIALGGGHAVVDPTLAVGAMEWVCARHRTGLKADVGGLAATLDIDPATAARLASRLAKAGLLLHFSDEGVIVPARPPEMMRVADALAVGIDMASQGRSGTAGGIVERLRAAQMQSVEELTFADRDPAPDPPRSTVGSMTSL